MKNSRLPTPSEVEQVVYASTKRALKSDLSADPSSCDETAACIASKAAMHCSLLLRYSDPRVDTHNIRLLKKHRSDFIFPKIDKNPGSTWVICRQLWAWLFMPHVLFAPHLKVVSPCETIPQADTELFSIIEERSKSCDLHTKWKRFFPRSPSYRFLAPPIALLMKDKSKEHLGLLKSRIFVSHFRHPTSHYGKLTSRCLSVLCASVSGDPSCLQIWEMNNCRQLFQEACLAASADSMAWQGLELDFVDMYHQIPTPSVIPAISYVLHYLQSRRAARRRYIDFSISKLQRSDDRFGTGASAWFKNVSIALVLDFISYEIFQNSFARADPWIIQQVGGLPMGGPLSAQLACLYLTSCELKNIRTSPFSFKILSKCYRDNLYFFWRGDHVSSFVNTLTSGLQQLYTMLLQFEQQGDTIQVLECLATVYPKQDIWIHLHSRAIDLLSRIKSYVNRCPDPWSHSLNSGRTAMQISPEHRHHSC